MTTGNISVNTENIFPIIKKFLYSDHEIFLRELISNAIDATKKLKTLSSLGEAKGELGDLKIEIVLDEKAKTLTIKDNGIGMTADEIEKYINQLAFSGAEEFVKKYKDKGDAQMIGHFGLGFYSAFMVADKVEIFTQSFKENSVAAHWTCTGSTEYEIEETTKAERGTDIVLHINEESKEFLEKWRIKELLKKYAKFLPVPIFFDGEQVNDTHPLWMKKASEVTEEEYQEFYSKLYPATFDKPLFWIHLNVDYPFNLTGILYFPKVKSEPEFTKNKIQLYSNQVFVTDEVKDIVPEFMSLMHGVIDSPDIPLNVSRSSLQSDAQVKKITDFITKKVADKLLEIFESDRKEYENKWESIGLFVKYGTISQEKFAEKAKQFTLLKNTGNEFYTIEEYKIKTAANQENKDKKTVWLYAVNRDTQYSYIHDATEKGYDVLLLDSPIDMHYVGYLEQSVENVQISRVDADHISKLIDKGNEEKSTLAEEQITALKDLVKANLYNDKWIIEAVNADENAKFITATQNEFMRRMKEMNYMSQFGMQDDPLSGITFQVNTNNPLAKKILEMPDEKKQKATLQQCLDLALISQNLLNGKAMADFLQRTEKILIEN